VANTYKETMNLPKTDFAMRANLPVNEPKRLEKWEQEHIYERVLEKNKDGEPFVLHDGPPYANGPIHIGHAFNKTLKDFVNKSHAQRGFYTPYIPGWDCHGQPIEHMVEEKLGPKKMKEIDQPTLRRLCREWAEKYVDIQREGFKRLGVNGDWDHPYLTFVPNYEAGNVEIFKKMYLDGSIYRGRKPIHWCRHCHTALAEAEIEYSDEVSPSIYVNFKLIDIPSVFSQAGVSHDAYVLIWTTTPWTLPANTAVSLAPKAEYVMVHADGKYMIMARELVESVAEIAHWDSYELVKKDGEVVSVLGSDLAGTQYVCPIRQDIVGRFIYGNHVTLDTGTGCVHTAPGHGQDDYVVSMKFDIPMIMPVNGDGVFTEEAGQFAGMDIDDATEPIINWLKSEGVLVASEKITHSYPHCWRCHEPVIFRATSQWFVSMDDTNLRENALHAIDHEVKWIPDWAKNRIGSMVADRPDWCISRQRSWGVPIPVFICPQCGNTVATEETFDAVIKLFYEEGADAWFTKKPSEYLPKGTHCEHCGCTELEPEKDILDVWWESGVSHTSVLMHRKDEVNGFPADMYLEGSDQHRGWFQSSLLTSVGAYGKPPYRSVMHCGFTVDGEGRKMSKSLGNGIDPADVMKTSGADVLRLWVSSVDYSQDVSISDEILQRTSEAYRRIRNTFRFLLGNLSDFNPDTDAVRSWDDLEPVDQWMLIKLDKLLKEVEDAYDAYKFHYVYRAVYDFIVNDLSAVYMDVCKDRLYSEAPNSRKRRSAQTIIFDALEVLVRILSPILSFTTDEVWEHYPQGLQSPDRPSNVQLAGWPSRDAFLPAIPNDCSEDLFNRFEAALEVRELVTKALEDARNEKEINKSQEARIEAVLTDELYDKIKDFDTSVFEELFIVSAVSFERGSDVSVRVLPAEGEKCPRCWNYRELGTNANHPHVCGRCGQVLDEIGYKEAE
jgi:isoleucyl-tRNA synthetase